MYLEEIWYHPRFDRTFAVWLDYDGRWIWEMKTGLAFATKYPPAVTDSVFIDYL